MEGTEVRRGDLSLCIDKEKGRGSNMKNSPLYVDLFQRVRTAIFCNTLSFCSMLSEDVTKYDMATG